MAIYSCNHTTVGRSTHAAGTAGAHARYVTRDGAAREVVGEHMPLQREAAKSWLDDQEAADRKNARMIDKVLVALPLELDDAQRVQLVRDFAAEIGKGRIPWLAGIHDKGDDAGNPHAHVIFRDRDHETGKRVAGLSEKGSTDRIRETWERMANEALERAGSDSRIDRRSLADQGVDRVAGIHVGPNVIAMEERGIRPTSRPQMTESGRVINWPKIDQGKTRLDHQAEIEAANENRETERDGKGKGDASSATLPPPQDAEKPARDTQEVPAATNPADKPPEAPRRPAQQAEDQVKPAKVADDRQADVSRFRQAIDRARQRLEDLGSRLDRAFNLIKERFAAQEVNQVAKPRLRRTLDDYRRDFGPDRSGPER